MIFVSLLKIFFFALVFVMFQTFSIKTSLVLSIVKALKTFFFSITLFIDLYLEMV